MQPIPHVSVQVALLVVLDAFIVVARGDALGIASTAIIGLGAGIALVFGATYHVRRWRRLKTSPISKTRLGADRQMAMLCFVGYGAPLAVAIAMTSGLRVDGLIFDSQASTVACLLPLCGLVAVVTSSAVDWYLIRPFQCGVLNEPLCSRGPDAPSEVSRRAHAKWWITHRGLCELTSYTSVALLIAIGAAAIGETIDADQVLKVAIGSFIGASTAVWLGGYVLSRIVPAWEYMQIQSSGLGAWSDGVDEKGKPISGFVRDVSLRPGIQLCPDPESAVFVPLGEAETAQDSDAPFAPLCRDTCRRWVERCDRHLRDKESAVGRPTTREAADVSPEHASPAVDQPS